MDQVADEVTKPIIVTPTIVTPTRVFIVPYRNRLQQKFFFCQQMNFILEEQTDYEILFIHQMDSRPFNRGAMKNIGFLAMKEKYPDTYKDITFIFNDVDTLPFHKLFDYQTVKGAVKHYYGFDSALGGIVVIKGQDFELVNGYPSYWGWGMEDACLQNRCLYNKIKIDRSHFYPIGSPEILQLFDGVERLVSPKDPQRMVQDRGIDGLKTIHKLTYTIDKESTNPADNKYIVANNYLFYVNVSSFMTLVHFESDQYHQYDLREPVRKVSFPDHGKLVNPTTFVNSPTAWKNIPTMPPSTPNPSQQQRQVNPNPFSQQANRNYPVRASKSVNIGMGRF